MDPPIRKRDKRPLDVDYPQRPPPRLSSDAEPKPSQREAQKNPTLSTPTQFVAHHCAWKSPPKDLEEHSEGSHHHRSSYSDMCQYLPGSEWYRDVITQNFQNPRKDKPITQWLSEWDQEFDDTSKSDWIRKKSRG